MIYKYSLFIENIKLLDGIGKLGPQWPYFGKFCPGKKI